MSAQGRCLRHHCAWYLAPGLWPGLQLTPLGCTLRASGSVMWSREEARARHAAAQSHPSFLTSSWRWTGSVCPGWGASHGGGEHTSGAWMCLPRDRTRPGRIPIAHIWSGSSSYKPPALAGHRSWPPHLQHEQPHGVTLPGASWGCTGKVHNMGQMQPLGHWVVHICLGGCTWAAFPASPASLRGQRACWAPLCSLSRLLVQTATRKHSRSRGNSPGSAPRLLLSCKA